MQTPFCSLSCGRLSAWDFCLCLCLCLLFPFAYSADADPVSDGQCLLVRRAGSVDCEVKEPPLRKRATLILRHKNNEEQANCRLLSSQKPRRGLHRFRGMSGSAGPSSSAGHVREACSDERLAILDSFIALESSNDNSLKC